MKRLASLFLILPLSACAMDGGFRLSSISKMFEPVAPSTQKLSRPIPSISKGSATSISSMEVISLTDGEAVRYNAQPFGNGVRVTQSDGCIWTRSNDWFAPSDSWAHCGTSLNWHTAQATVRELNSIYPLKIGSTGVYERSAVSHTGRKYTRKTTCEVTDAVDVVRTNGSLTPAYVIVCKNKSRIRTTWYAPSEGPIAYREMHRHKGVEVAWLRDK